MITRVPVDNRMFTIKTDVEVDSLIVDYDDIEGRVEYDECMNDAPWDNCDGFEHVFHAGGYYTHEGLRDSRGWVNRSAREGGSGYIEIDDDDVIEWGCTGYPGCSKQVRFEAIARAKRETTEALVKWYEQGWEYFVAYAEYGDYRESCGMIDSYKYAEEVAEECRREVAACMIHDGYIVENMPEPPKPYNRYDAFRDKIKRQLTL